MDEIGIGCEGLPQEDQVWTAAGRGLAPGSRIGVPHQLIQASFGQAYAYPMGSKLFFEPPRPESANEDEKPSERVEQLHDGFPCRNERFDAGRVHALCNQPAARADSVRGIFCMPCAKPKARSEHAFESDDQFRWRNVECARQPPQYGNGGGVDAALYLADVGAIDLGLQGQELL
jgi:hypothetical protein